MNNEVKVRLAEWQSNELLRLNNEIARLKELQAAAEAERIAHGVACSRLIAIAEAMSRAILASADHDPTLYRQLTLARREDGGFDLVASE